MPSIEWIGSGRRDADNSQSDPSRLINMYRENLNGKTVIKGVLGCETFAQLDGAFTRAMAEIEGQIYAAHGGNLTKIDRQGFTYQVGQILSSPDTTISSNNGKITVAAGGDLFVFDNGVRSTPETGAFSEIGSVSFIGQRTIITERNGRRVQWSGVANASTYDGLDFATAEQRDDKIVRGVAIGGQYYIFGEKSIEQWYLTGADNFIAYRPGSLIDIGLKAFGLFALIPNGGFFVGTDNIVYLVSGGSLKPVSIRSVESAIDAGTADKTFYYEDEGHKFCVIRFRDRPSWVYDISMDEWHERSEGEDFGAWSAVDSVKAFGSFYIGTQSGAVCRLARVNYDATQHLFRRAVSANLNIKGEFFCLDSVEVYGRFGQGRVTEDVNLSLQGFLGTAVDNGSNGGIYTGVGNMPIRGGQLMLRVSKDRGKTFGKSRWRDLGDLGEYDKVVKYRALGAMRNACIELTFTDPIEMTFETKAEIELS